LGGTQGGTPAIRVSPTILTFVKPSGPASRATVTSSNAVSTAKAPATNSAGLVAVIDKEGRKVIPKGSIQVESNLATTTTTRPAPVRKPAANGKGEVVILHGEFDVSSVAHLDKDGKVQMHDEPANLPAKPVK
jgi:hypothetical protein